MATATTKHHAGDIFDTSILENCRQHPSESWARAAQPVRVTRVEWMGVVEGAREPGDYYFGGGIWVIAAGAEQPTRPVERCRLCAAGAR